MKAQKVPNNQTFIQEFQVDRALRGHLFSQARDAQFRLAVEEWNKYDGPKRARIELPETIMSEDDLPEKLEQESGLPHSALTARWEEDDAL